MTDPTPSAPEPRPSGWRALAESVGLIPPRDGRDPYAHRRGEPRGFTVIWLLFLFLVAALVYGSIGNPVFASAEGYRLASKVLLTTVAAGIVTVWPVLRLTQQAPLAGGVSATARDIAIVLIPMQALIWPQSLITGWGIDAVAAIAILLAGWTLIVGAIVALAIGPQRSHPRARAALGASPFPIAPGSRAVAMAAILILPLLAPAGLLLLDAPPGSEPGAWAETLSVCSPFTAPWELFEDRSWTGAHARALAQHWKPVLLTLLAGAAAWAALLTIRRITRVEDRPASA